MVLHHRVLLRSAGAGSPGSGVGFGELAHHRPRHRRTPVIIHRAAIDVPGDRARIVDRAARRMGGVGVAEDPRAVDGAGVVDRARVVDDAGGLPRGRPGDTDRAVILDRPLVGQRPARPHDELDRGAVDLQRHPGGNRHGAPDGATGNRPIAGRGRRAARRQAAAIARRRTRRQENDQHHTDQGPRLAARAVPARGSTQNRRLVMFSRSHRPDRSSS